MKKMFSLFMAVAIFVMVIPQLGISASAASLTQAQVEERMASVRKQYEGKRNRAWYVNGLYVGSQCHGYARWLSWKIWDVDFQNGNGKNWSRYSSSYIDNIAPGDVVRYHRANVSYNHTIFITGVQGDTIYFTDCNSDGNNIIKWDRTVKRATLKSYLNNQLYDYKNETSRYGYIAHYKLNNLAGKHTHNYKLGYEAVHPHRYYYKCSCGDYYYTGKNAAMPSCSECKLKSYPTPLKAYTIKTGKTIVYSSINGNAKSNKIYNTDLCTITDFYNNGWCKVTFPLDKGGTDTGYVKTSVFISGKSQNISKVKTANKVNTYKRSDLSSKTGYAAKSDTVYIIGQTDSAVQIAYPLIIGGHKAAWISMSDYNKICGTKSNTTYTIAYNANGGKGTMSNTAMKYGTAKNLAPNAFKKSGYTFLGWSTNKNAAKATYTNKQSVKNLAKSGTVTLYAVWKKV